MQKAALIGLLLLAGCSGPMIHGRVGDGITVRMYGDARLEQVGGEFELKCEGNTGDIVMLYFLRQGYYPQIRPVKTPEGKLEEKTGPWKKLPDDQNGVWAGVVCTFGAGGRHAHVFFFEEFKKSQTIPVELDGELSEIKTDENGVFMLLLPPGSHKIKVAWAPELPGDTEGTVDIEAATTTIFDVCKISTLVD
jgi:hypothetical protein